MNKTRKKDTEVYGRRQNGLRYKLSKYKQSIASTNNLAEECRFNRRAQRLRGRNYFQCTRACSSRLKNQTKECLHDTCAPARPDLRKNTYERDVDLRMLNFKKSIHR
ncbi:hypothetical protein EVAR_11920_1 [Eumeta japonica]|uniref:Uncharacterized protein n=1 Tax=Eumeta variegata TaxID=151549 RepID=A0A4C1U8Z6_EUMVA|nr:hypothetical protein EVAR_11920_1 [Eumeta japonica]